jgi:hypothetical protein
MNAVKIKKVSSSPNILLYIGHVKNVINGIVPDKLKNQRFMADSFKYGFEAGTPQGIYNIGECIIMNGLIYSSRTDLTRNERDHLMWGPEFVTPGMFLVPHSCEVSFTGDYCSLYDGITFDEIYKSIFTRINRPFTIVGCAELSYSRTVSVTHSPIEKECIFDHKEKYYDENVIVENNANIAFMGVVSNPFDNSLISLNKKLDAVLYYNPFSEKRDLISHTHALTLLKPEVDIENVQPHNAKDVVHLTGESVIRYAKFEIYMIDDIEEYRD